MIRHVTTLLLSAAALVLLGQGAGLPLVGTAQALHECGARHGARDVDQLAPALAAAEVEMTPELRERVSALTPAPPPATDRNEETRGIRYGTR